VKKKKKTIVPLYSKENRIGLFPEASHEKKERRKKTGQESERGPIIFLALSDEARKGKGGILSDLLDMPV